MLFDYCWRIHYKDRVKKKLIVFGAVIVVSVSIVYGIYFCKLSRIKNVILLIGDGMGPQQIGLLMQYAKYAPQSVVADRVPHFQRIVEAGEVGMMLPYPMDNLVVDSAASATHLATGHFSRNEMIGLDRNGYPVETVLEKARKRGKATGLVSDTRATHATPAAFAAHRIHRAMENEIAEDLLKVQPDVILSGGLRHWIPKNRKGSKRNDLRDLVGEAKAFGYDVVFTQKEMVESQSSKILGLFSFSLMPPAIDRDFDQNEKGEAIPHLVDLTRKALAVLSNNPKGFFLMVESGRIDHAGHANDVGALLHEMLVFDQTVGVVFDWVKSRKDTLVVITADHETGSFGFGYSKRRLPSPQTLPSGHRYQPRFNFGDPAVLDKIYQQKRSFESIISEFDRLPPSQRTPFKLKELVNAASEFKISLKDANAILQEEPNRYRVLGHKHLSREVEPKISDFKEFYVYGAENRSALIARALAKEQQVTWGNGTHTATPVMLVAYGPRRVTGAFDGLLHATDVGSVLIRLIEQ